MRIDLPSKGALKMKIGNRIFGQFATFLVPITYDEICQSFLQLKFRVQGLGFLQSITRRGHEESSFFMSPNNVTGMVKRHKNFSFPVLHFVIHA